MEIVQTAVFSNKFSQNLLPKKSSFTDTVNPPIFNTVSGLAGFASGDPYRLDYSFFVSNLEFTTNDLVFNIGDTFTTEIPEEGYYFFQMAIRDDVAGANSFLPFDFEVLIYKNAVHTDTFEGSFNVDSTTYDGKWVVFSQKIFIDSLAVIDFAFKIINNPSSPTSTQNCQIGMIKLELDNKFLVKPTPYSLPRNFYDSNKITGWASYADTTYTSGSPFAILSGITSILDNDSQTIINTEIPNDASTFYNLATNKITPTNLNDKYLINIKFKARTSIINDALTIGIDVGGAEGFVVKTSESFVLGANTEQQFDIIFTAFASATFIANGGLVKVTALAGDLDIYDISYIIERTYKPI